jgi:hypothetical protein
MLAPAPRQRESHMVQARHSALVDLGDTRRVPLLLGLAVGMLLTVSVMSCRRRRRRCFTRCSDLHHRLSLCAAPVRQATDLSFSNAGLVAQLFSSRVWLRRSFLLDAHRSPPKVHDGGPAVLSARQPGHQDAESQAVLVDDHGTQLKVKQHAYAVALDCSPSPRLSCVRKVFVCILLLVPLPVPSLILAHVPLRVSAAQRIAGSIVRSIEAVTYAHARTHACTRWLSRVCTLV